MEQPKPHPQALDKLRMYLKMRGISESALAREVGISAASISRYMSRERYPSYRTMRRFQEATHGVVTINDWNMPL